MRYIQTSNKHIQFIEADDNGIIKSRGFEFGTVTYQISNGKITFYPVDTDKPWSQDLWSINIPFIMDGETYSTPEEAGAALGGIMDNSLLDKIEEVQQTVASQQQEIEDLDDNLSEVSDDLDAEVVRASAKDAEHDAAIDDLANDISDEEARATSAETALQTAINAETTRAMDEESAIRGSVNAEVSRATSAESALQASITAETNRAQSAETANANAISAEEDRAIAAETALHAEVVAETNRAQTAEQSNANAITAEANRAQAAETEIHDEISAERTRALNAESALSESIDAEVTRATAKDASQDALISGLNNSLTAEINRATGAENGLRDDLNAEVSARTATDNSLIQRVTAVEVGKADANSVYTKQESDDKYATKDYVSGLTDNFYTKGQTNELLAAKADKANAVASAEYISNNKIINFKNIDGTVISSIDATDFIKDGMVDNVKVENGYLVITFNTDSGKEAISIPLTDIFDPANYYTKSEVNTALSGKVDNAAFNTLSGDVYSISGDVVTISGSVETVRQEIATISGDSYTKQEVNTAIDAATSGKADTSTVTALSDSLSGYTTTGDTNALSGAVTAHTANTTVHVTASEKQTWNAKQDSLVSGTNIKTVNGESLLGEGNLDIQGGSSYTAGDGIDITNDVISVTGKVDVSDNTVADTGIYIPFFQNANLPSGYKFRVKEIVYDFDKTTSMSCNVGITDYETWNNYNITVVFDYVNKTYEVQGESGVVDIVYDTDIEDFCMTISSNYATNCGFAYAYCSDECYMNLRFDTITSGQSANVIEDSISGILSNVYNNILQKVNSCRLDVNSGRLVVMYDTDTNTSNIGTAINLEDLKAENRNGRIYLSSDINIPLGTSAWTEAAIESTCDANQIVANKHFTTFRIKCNVSSLAVCSLQIAVGYDGNYNWENIDWDSNEQTFIRRPSTDPDIYSAATINLDSQTGYLTVAYPSTIIVDGQEKIVNFYYIQSQSCAFGTYIEKFEYWSESVEPIKEYVQENRSALGGKQDTLVSGTNIKTINGNSILGSGNLDIQGGGSSITVVQTTGTSTGDVMSQSAVTASLSGKADSSALTAHTANTTVHVTASEKQTWNNKSNFSGSYNDLTNKPTIPTIWTGTQAQFDAITIKDSNTIYLVQ